MKEEIKIGDLVTIICPKPRKIRLGLVLDMHKNNINLKRDLAVYAKWAKIAGVTGWLQHEIAELCFLFLANEPSKYRIFNKKDLKKYVGPKLDNERKIQMDKF